MSKHNYFLRGFRKQTDITQSDIGFLMNLPDYSKVSRWEKGQTTPTIEILFVYHFLFDIPMDALFERQTTGLHDYLVNRIGLLIQELKQVKPDEKVNSRIAFLDAALTRLTA
jgi:transcriptional regulator with XRE-family HTH domain